MKINIKTKIKIFGSIVFLAYFCLVFFADANYTLLEPIGDISNVETGEFGLYLSEIFILSLQLATALAVLMISFGGFKYLTVESFIGKADAQKTINNAVIGLFILLTAWLLLSTINPDLVNQEFKIPSPTDISPPSSG